MKAITSKKKNILIAVLALIIFVVSVKGVSAIQNNMGSIVSDGTVAGGTGFSLTDTPLLVVEIVCFFFRF